LLVVHFLHSWPGTMPWHSEIRARLPNDSLELPGRPAAVRGSGA
jgi:hypothetical protein